MVEAHRGERRFGDISVRCLCFESLGVRSMCVFVETPDVSVLLDPGVSLGKRFSLIPHPREYRALIENREIMKHFAERAEVLVISHYHFDHYTPCGITDYVWMWNTPEIAEEIYTDKVVLAKDIRSEINLSQRRRGWIFKKTAAKYVRELEYADGRCWEFGSTKLEFTEPIFHGERDTPLGWVLAVYISRNDHTVLFAPDVQGPLYEEALQVLSRAEGDLAIVGGPPLYLSETKMGANLRDVALKNLANLCTHFKACVVDHHLIRSEHWPTFVQELRSGLGLSPWVETAADFAEAEVLDLEWRRAKLYEEDPPPQDFLRWAKLPRLERKKTPPPL